MSVLALALHPLPAVAERVSDSTLQFAITIPDDFVADAQLVTANRDFVSAFRRTDTATASSVIIIERMRGTISRDKLDAGKLPRGFTGRLFTLPWKSFDVETIELPEEVQGVQTINYNVQLPLKPEAIQIRVVGLREKKDELLQLTQNLLTSLDGQSNWLVSVAPTSVSESPQYTTVLVVVSAVVFFVGLVLLWLLRRFRRKGMVLGIAAVIYAISYMLPAGESREMRMTVGVARMLGFTGMLVGAFDLFRPYKKQPPPLPATNSL